MLEGDILTVSYTHLDVYKRQGVITTVTLLPSLLLAFDKVIEKTKHKELLPEFKKFTNFIVNHYKAMIVVFLLLLAPAIYGNNNVKVYYNLNKSLPDTLQSVSANKELQEKFNMVSTQMVLVNKDMKADTAKQMINAVSYTHLDVYKRQVYCSSRTGKSRNLGSSALILR